MSKKDKMVSCGASSLTNWAEKNSNIITLVTIIIVVLTIWRHTDNSDTFNAWCIFKILSNISDDEVYWEPWHSQNSLFKHFQEYLRHSGILMHIQGLWHWLCSTLLLIEKTKKCQDFGKRGPDCVHLWGFFSIQMVVLRVFGIENFKMFPCGVFFSLVFDELFIEVPQFHETSPAVKNFWLHTWLFSVIIILTKGLILDSVLNLPLSW